MEVQSYFENKQSVLGNPDLKYFSSYKLLSIIVLITDNYLVGTISLSAARNEIDNITRYCKFGGAKGAYAIFKLAFQFRFLFDVLAAFLFFKLKCSHFLSTHFFKRT